MPTAADIKPPTLAALQAAIVSQASFASAAAAFASELATGFRCERVSVGFVEDGFARIAAISHGGSPTGESEILDLLGNAMDEAIEQRATVRYPPVEDSPPRIVLAHQAIVRRQGGGLCTIPLVSAGRIVGAILFEFADERSFEPSTLATAEHLISLLGPVLELMRRNELPLHRQLAEAIRHFRQQLGTPERRRLRIALVATSLVLLLLLLLPLPHQVGGQARVEGAIQRVLVAPADGYLKQVFVRPGDAVEAGQVLVEMAEQDLQIERRRWASELAQHENAYAAALARADRAQLVINQARADEARAQLALIDQELGRSRIEAPFAGIVIKGDLSQSLGAPVKRGDALLTLAPGEKFRVIIEIDERDIARIAIGDRGHLALSALPWETHPLVVRRITPMATAVEDANVFEVEAELIGGETGLRPGLQGVARVDAGHQPLLLGWTQRGLTWLRLKLWAWWGI